MPKKKKSATRIHETKSTPAGLVRRAADYLRGLGESARTKAIAWLVSMKPQHATPRKTMTPRLAHKKAKAKR